MQLPPSRPLALAFLVTFVLARPWVAAQPDRNTTDPNRQALPELRANQPLELQAARLDGSPER
jgi:hypothetical protein